MSTALIACAGTMTSPVSAQEKKGVKIGVLGASSGPYGDVGGHGSVVAAQMAIADFGGSVLGQPIELVSADHQSKPDTAVTIARSWFDVDGVDVITDLSTSPVAIAVQKLAADKKRITLNSTASTDALTNHECTAYGAHWTYDSYSIGKVVASGVAKPGSTWFFLTVDNAGGTGLQNALTPFLQAKGAKIVGGVRHPINTTDMSSFLLQAQASKAQYIALANGGMDTTTALKQAQEFGLSQNGQTLVGTAIFLSDVRAMGLADAGGLQFGTGFVNDRTPEAAEWSRRFIERFKTAPNDVHAGVYSSILHYLKAVKAAGTKDADAVMAKMRETPVNDMFATNGVLRKDGRMVHDMYLVQVKKPAESKGPNDIVKLVQTIPGAEAFRPLSESGCSLVKAAQ
ncbi:ABC transporter substrate-binding protein [Bosea sp. MMO-172]|uniref:ABC transporter substrate-binding protein n=1 Tax=Bosea sp. MMO-172 TaxID=3127885 RepID=UPI00301A1D1E